MDHITDNTGATEEKDVILENVATPPAEPIETPPAPPSETPPATPTETPILQKKEQGGGFDLFNTPPPPKPKADKAAEAVNNMIGEESAAKAAKMFTILLNSSIGRVCSFMNPDKNPNEYRPSPQESKEYEEACKEFFKTVNVTVSPVFSFVIMTASIYGLIIFKAYLHYQASKKMAELLERKAAQQQAQPKPQPTPETAKNKLDMFNLAKEKEEENEGGEMARIMKNKDLLLEEVKRTPEIMGEKARTSFTYYTESDNVEAQYLGFYKMDKSNNRITFASLPTVGEKPSRLILYLLDKFRKEESKRASATDEQVTPSILEKRASRKLKDFIKEMRGALGL